MNHFSLFFFSPCLQLLYIKMSEPYDPYIPNSQRGDAAPAKTTRVQQQVDEVVGIMQENIDKVMQRGERLDDLRGKTGKKKRKKNGLCRGFIILS
ncbi:unnamed protein product [Rhizopus stolonifer]